MHCTWFAEESNNQIVMVNKDDFDRSFGSIIFTHPLKAKKQMNAQKNTGTNQNMGVSNQNDLSVAHQWIDYLKRRSRNATILWVLFLVLATGGISAAFYNYLQLFEFKVEVEKDRLEHAEELKRLGLTNDDLANELDRLKETYKADLESANNEVTKLQATLDELDQLKGQTGDQLEISAKLVAALKQKVAKLEEERTLLEDALSSSKRELDTIAASQSVNEAMIKDQKESLENRTNAYQALVKRLKNMEADIDTKSSENDRLASKLNSSNSSKQALLKEVSKLNSDNQKLTSERDALESKLKALTQPVAAIKQKTPVKISSPKILGDPSQAIAGTTNDNQTKSTPRVVAPAKDNLKPQSSAANELSFDSIAID